MSNLLTDLHVLTSIPRASFDKLTEKSIWCICSDVEESILKKENITKVDIGIGDLYIKLEDDMIKYKFIPSQQLEEAVKNTVLNGKNVLIDVVETTLAARFVNTYKDIFQ